MDESHWTVCIFAFFPRHRVPGFVTFKTAMGGQQLQKFTPPFFMGTAPGAGQQLGGAGAWEGAEKRPCRQVGVSPAVISALASCQPHPLSPSPWAEAISVHVVS